MELPRRRQDLDAILSEYIEHLWSTGEGRALANDTAAGLQDQDPRLRGLLPVSWRLLKAWSANEIPNRAPPFPEVVVHAMAGWALGKGDLSFAISLLLGFYCMLRTGELLGLFSHHISMPKPRQVAVISLGLTKGGKRQGAALSALKLESFAFRPYSLRRGGATHWFRHHGSFDKLLVQGRWAAPKTAKIYINEGLAILAELNLSEKPLKPFVQRYCRALL